MSDTTLPPIAPSNPVPTVEQITASRNAYEARLKAERDQRMMSVFRQAVTINPAARSEAEGIAKRLGQPVEALDDNLEVALEMLRVRELQETSRSYPNLDKRLDKLQFTSLVHDDLGNLKTTEDTFDWIRRNVNSGRYMNERGEIGARMMAGSRDPDDVRRLDELKLLTQDAGQDTGFVASALQLGGQMAGPMAKSFAASAVVAGAVSTFSGPGAVVTGPSAFATTMLASTFAQTAVVEGGNAYLDMLDKGYDKDASLLGAAFVGMANGALEVVGMGIVLNPLRKAFMRRAALKLGQVLTRPTTAEAVKTLAKEYVASVFGEAAQEGTQELVNVITEAAVRTYTDPKLPAPSWGEIGQRVSEAFLTTAKGMAILGLPAPSIRFISDQHAVTDAKEHMKFMEALQKGATESKVLKRDPDVYEQHLKATAEGLPVKDLFINGKVFAETLQQLDSADTGDGIAATASQRLEATIPGITERIKGAARTDSDVVVPIEQFIARLSSTDVGDALMKHTRPSESARSFAESEAIAGELQTMKAEADAMLTEKRATDQAFVDSARAVEDGLVQQLQPMIGTEAVPDAAAARLEASFYASFAVVNAAELKITPEEFATRYPYRVVAAQARKVGDSNILRHNEQKGDGTQSQAFNQLPTDTPEFRAWFAGSRMVDATGVPITMYHGAGEQFDTFSEAHTGGLFWFTDNKDIAGAYAKNRGGTDGRVVPAYLQVKNPLDLRTEAGVRVIAGLDPEFNKANVSKDSTLDARRVIRRANQVGPSLFWHQTKDAKFSDAWTGVIVPQLQALGYDAMHMGDAADTGNAVAVFEPTQIKSVNNRGTFDPNDANILHQNETDAGPAPTPDPFGLADAASGDSAQSLGRREPPVYGTAREGASRVRAVHYSQQPRVFLTSEAYGTGLNGAERNRVAGDPVLGKRIYFYVDTGAGITPEPGVGSIAHDVVLANVYDINADPAGVIAKWRETRTGNASEDFNAMERAVHDAGFDGYYVPAIGAAALVGPEHTNVPVQQVSHESQATGRQQAEAGAVPDQGRVRGSTGLLDESLRQDPVDDAPLEGLPRTTRVGGEDVAFGPSRTAREAAVRYMREAGLAYNPPRVYVQVDTDRAARIAQAFEEMPHDPSNPDVMAAYDAMIRETIAQWQAIKETGLRVEFIDGADPYGNPRNAIRDVVENNHLWVYPTDAGFGGTESADVDITGNPLLQIVEGETISGQQVRANDIFRIVHDYFGHIKEGVGFRARGEENAWQQHMAMYSPLARKAATVETRGQNSWVNFGPFAESNRTADGASTQYAPQKIGLLPEWVVEDGYAGGEAFATGERKKVRGMFSPKTLTTLLFKKADTSTFLHETAHYFLTVYSDMAQRHDATPAMRANMQTLLNWFGVKDLATWNAMSIDEQRRHHEAFAYNFEVYLFENKAPTKELRTMFARFAEWLRVTYKNVRDKLNAIYRKEFGQDLPLLTGEVRQVMDRMVASEEAVAAEYARRDLVPQFQTQEDSGLDDGEWAAYQALEREQRDEAVAEVTAASMRNVQWMADSRGREAKKSQAQHDELRAKVRREVVQELQQNPRDQARRWLRRGEIVQPDGTVEAEPKGTEHKLDRGTVVAMLPAGTDLKPLSGMLKVGGLHPDHVAEALGGDFKTGRDLLNALIEMRPFDDAVNQRTNQRMMAEHAEFVEGTPAWAARVNQAVNGQARARFAAVELRILQKATAPVRVMLDAAREAARQALEKMKVADVDMHKLNGMLDYVTRNLHDAQRRGDVNEMIVYKRKQLLYHQLISQAHDARAEISDARAKFRKIFRNEAKLTKTHNVDYVLATRWLLSKFGLTTPLQAQAAEVGIARIRSNEPERLSEIDALVTDAVQNAKPFTELSMLEFRDLRNIASYLWARSKRDMEIEVAGKKELRADAVAEMLATMRNVLGEAPAQPNISTDKSRRASRFSSTVAKLKRIEHWAIQMDGGKAGPVTNYLFRPLRERYDSYMIDRERMVRRIRDGIKTLKLSDAKIAAPELIGAPVFDGTKQLLGAVQHAGNLSNLRKLLLGYKWTEALPDGGFNRERWDSFMSRMMAEGHLTKEHLDYLQMVWTLNEKELRPIAQKVNREVYGLFFEEIQAAPFETPWGTYAGGYMPAKLDPDHPANADVRQRQALDGVQAMESDFRDSMSGTARGFTITRNQVTRPLLLDVRLQARHIDELLRFVHLQPALRDVAGILKDREFAGYLNSVDPSAIKDMLIPWLNDTARNQVTKPSSMPALDKFFGFLRRSTGLNFMFGSVRNALQQITGLSNVFVYVKGRHVRDAMWRYYTSAPSTTNWVAETSPFMQLRLRDQIGQLQDDIDLLLDPSWMGELKRWTNKHGYFAQRFMQNQVDVVAWLAAYQQALENAPAGMTDAEVVRNAIAEGDSVVRRTQGSVTPIDTAGYERSSAFARLFTQFSSYYNTVLNQVTSAPPGSKTRAALLGLALPAFGAAVIAALASGGEEFDDKDEDGTMDEVLMWLFSTQAKAGLATLPGFGPLIAQAASGDKRVGDRLAPAPAWSALQALARSVSNLTSGDPSAGSRETNDAFTVFSVATGVPLGGVGRSIGYVADVKRGKVEPRDTLDYLRGVASGRASRGTRIY